MVCTSRGTDKPTLEELTQTGACKPLATERGSAPAEQCLDEANRQQAKLHTTFYNVEQSAAFGLALAICDGKLALSRRLSRGGGMPTVVPSSPRAAGGAPQEIQ